MFSSVLILTTLATAFAQLAPVLPYSTRTRAYNGWSSFARGDLRTIGLAGATVGLADTYIAAMDNPAGLAMTMQGVTLQFGANQIHDGNLQQYEAPIESTMYGGTANVYPYGFSFGWWTPHEEGQSYRLAPTDLPKRLEVQVREFQLSGARVFGNNRWSVGAALIFGQAQHSVGEATSNSFRLGGSIGVMYRFANRWLLGASYATPMEYKGDPERQISGAPVDFFQPVKSPARIAIGSGWIPNRFFQLGMGMYFLGTTEDTALLSNQAKAVGARISAQPRIGTDYLFAEFKELQARAGVGSYFEFSRTEGEPGRLHATAAVEVAIWVVGFGWGIDKAEAYTNFIYAAGVDIIKVMKKLDLIPMGYSPPRLGLFPHPFRQSDEGLPRPLVKNWKDTPPQPDIIDIGKQLPRRLEHKLEDVRDTLLDAVAKPPTEYDEPPTPPKSKAAPAAPAKKGRRR